MIKIAIDGPAGAGKSTLAKKVAREMGYVYVDTGAMYRAIAFYMIQNAVPFEDREAVVAALPDISVTIRYENGEQTVWLNGENVNSMIRTQEVGNKASVISAIPQVRAKLLELQRGLAEKENVIMDGRDIGTVVLPDADLKIYLTASSAVRANRRYLELCERGLACDRDEIEKEIIQRDEQDMNREISPLRKAEDAVLLDSSDLTVEGTVNAMLDLIRKTVNQ